MTFSRWMILIAALVGVGCLEVAQRSALVRSGYAVAERQRAVEAHDAAVTWLNAQVIGLSSPAHLAQVAQQRRLKLVAWSTLEAAPSRSHSPVRMAALSGREAE
jgi:hypothetical protein